MTVQKGYLSSLPRESYLHQRLYFIIYANEAIKSRCILLYLLDLHDKKLIDDEVLLKSVEVVLSLTFRAKMCKAKGINHQFAGNVLQRLGEIEDYSDFMNAFWKVLTFGKGSFAFPSNEEFREALTEKDLYLTIRSKGVKYLIYALEEKSPFPILISFVKILLSDKPTSVVEHFFSNICIISGNFKPYPLIMAKK